MEKLEIKEIIIIVIFIFFLLSLFSSHIIYQFFCFKQNKGLALLNTIAEVTKKDIREILILGSNGIHSNFGVDFRYSPHQYNLVFHYKIFLDSYECGIAFFANIFNITLPKSESISIFTEIESIIEKNYALFLYFESEKLSNPENRSYVKKLGNEFIEKFKTNINNNIPIIDQINIFNKFIKTQSINQIVDFPLLLYFLMTLIWIPFISLIPSSYSILFFNIWLIIIIMILLYLLKYLLKKYLKDNF